MATMSTLQILTAARAKIAQGWCINIRGRDADGDGVEGWSPKAVRWCALGAIDAAVGMPSYNGDTEAVHLLYAHLPEGWQRGWAPAHWVAVFNDATCQAEVLALFDRTIAALEVKSPELDPAFVKIRASLSRDLTVPKAIAKALIPMAGMAVLAGCAPAGSSYVNASSPTNYSIGGGRYVREFRLSDGTRCVVVMESGIACEWKRNEPSQTP